MDEMTDTEALLLAALVAMIQTEYETDGRDGVLDALERIEDTGVKADVVEALAKRGIL